MLVVAVANNDDAELREEDYAAAMMAIQNLSLVAVEMGLGTHIKTGAVMADPASRAAAGVKDNERIIADREHRRAGGRSAAEGARVGGRVHDLDRLIVERPRA